MAVRTIRVNLSADITNFQQNITRAERTLGSLGSEMNNNMRRISANTQLMLAQLGNTGTFMQQARIKATGLTDKLAQQTTYVNRLQSELTSASARFGATSTQVRNLELQLLRAATAEQTMRNQLGQLNAEMSRSAQFARLGQAVQTPGMELSAGVTLPVGLAAKKGISYNADIEQNIAAYETLIGDADKAKALFGSIVNMAAKTPFEIPDLADSSKVLLGYGVNAKNIMPSLRMLGDVSMGNKDKLQRLTLAFGQIMANGRLMGQDLLQLVNAGFNPLQTMSEKTGKSMSALRQEMEDGKISSKMVVQAFQDATSKGGRFYQAMDKQSKTFNGQMSTLRDNINMTLGAMFKPISDALTNRFLPALNAVFEKIRSFAQLHPVITGTVTTFLLLAASIGPVLLSISALSRGVTLAIQGFNILKTGIATAITFLRGLSMASVITAGKILLTALSVVALAATAWLLIKNWEVVKTWFSSFWDSSKAGFQELGAYIKLQFWNAIGSVSEAIDTLRNNMAKLPGMSGLAVGISDSTKAAYAAQQAATRDLYSAGALADSARKKLASVTSDSFNKIAAQAKNDIAYAKGWLFGSIDSAAGDAFGNGEFDTSDLKDSAKEAKEAKDKTLNELQQFVDKVRQQAKQYSDSLGLFEKATMEKISGERLLVRLQNQVKIFDRWKNNISDLKNKLGSNSSLFQELLSKGPSAAGQIGAINSLDKTRLKEYESLFGQKNDIALGVGATAAAAEKMNEKKVEQIAVNLNGGVYVGDMNQLANMIAKQLKLQGVY